MTLEFAVSNFLNALASGARSAACTLLGLPQYLNDMTTRLSGGLFTPPLSQIPNLWRRALCDTDAPPPSPPPFTGGQCPTTYTLVINYVGQSELIGGACADRSGSTGGNVLGPIQFLGTEEERTGGDFRIVARFLDGNGELVELRTATFSDSCGGGSITSIVATRVDGQPDDCGDPPPYYPPLTPPDVEIPRDIIYENNEGVSVTIPVVFVFARAQLTVDADVVIPFTVNLSPTLNITGNLNLDGQVDINLGGGNATSLPKDPRKGDCDDIALPDGEVPEDPTGSDQPDEPEREKSQVITGVLVTVNQISSIRQTVIDQGENPDIYAPSLGHVNFLVRVGSISAGWTPDLPVKNRRCLIQCPWNAGAIDVKGTPQPGVTWTLTPVFGYAGVAVEYVG